MKTKLTLAAKLFVNRQVGRGTPCAPQVNNSETARRGLTRPTSARSTFALLLSILLPTTASLLMLCQTSAHAQGGVPLWTNSYGCDSAVRIAADTSGNVVVTSDCAMIKYSPAGVPLWTNLFGETCCTAIAADQHDNIFVSGSVNAASDLHPEGDLHRVIVKYSNAGVPLWTNLYDGQLYNEPGGFNDWAGPIAVDSDGNALVTGASGGGTRDFVTIKYSNAGVPLWTNRWNELGYDEARGIAVDRNGNVFVTGVSGVSQSTANDYATVAYSAGGDFLWVNYYDWPLGNSFDIPTGIAVDNGGNVFVTGRSTGDYATVAYSGAGLPLWANRYEGPGLDAAAGIAVDSNGSVFVTGYSYPSGSGYADWVTIKYSSDGLALWTRRYSGPGNSVDYAYAIAVDRSGNVFVTGSSGNGSATVAYSNSGVPLWTNRFNGIGNQGASLRAITLDGNGNVFVSGGSWNGTSNENVTIKYSSSIPPPRLDFQKLNNGLVLSWTNAGFHLQTAPAVTGPFTNLPAATSPYTNPLTAPQQFFRLAAP